MKRREFLKSIGIMGLALAVPLSLPKFETAEDKFEREVREGKRFRNKKFVFDRPLILGGENVNVKKCTFAFKRKGYWPYYVTVEADSKGTFSYNNLYDYYKGDFHRRPMGEFQTG